MSAAEAVAIEAVEYQYNKLGNVRAPLQTTIEIMLDMKLVQQSNATDDYLKTVGGQAGEARSMGFELGFRPVTALGIETLNEMTGQWRILNSATTVAIVACFPN